LKPPRPLGEGWGEGWGEGKKSGNHKEITLYLINALLPTPSQREEELPTLYTK